MGDIGVKKASLYTLILSVGISALLGCFALLVGDFGETELKILFTTLSISAGSILCLGCGFSLEKGGRKPLAATGMLLSALGTLLLLAGIWIEIDSETYWKSTVILWLFGTATAHMCLLSLARLASRFAWSVPLAYGVVYALAALMSGMVLADESSELLMRILGVLAILGAALTVMIPIFHRLSLGETAPSRTDRPPPRDGVPVLCPVCGARQGAQLGRIECRACGARFLLQILDEEPEAD